MEIICSNCLIQKDISLDSNLICENCNKELLLNSRYQFIKIIGQNSGTTYIARDLGSNLNSENKVINISVDNLVDNSVDNLVVIKELSIKKMKNWKNEELFQRERSVLLSLDHDRIPKILDKFDKRVGKRVSYYTVIEYINGESLEKVIKKNKFSDIEVMKMLKEISEILEYMHSLNPPIIHRDLKPSNIMIKNKEYYLIDFGSVTDIVKEEGGSTIAGTFGYMAPEQFLGKSEKASDYYALGILSLEMLSGIPPEQFMIGDRINWKMLNISKKMKNILQPLLIYDYKKRVQSKDELQRLLEPPIKEREYDIIGILEKYKEIKDLYEKHNKKFNIIYFLSFLVFLYWTISVDNGNAKVLIITLYFFLVGGFYLFSKNNRFSRNLIEKMRKERFNEQDILVVSNFIENKFKSDAKKNYYYKLLNSSIYLNIEKSLKYEKAFKENHFLETHIRRYNIYGEEYVKELKNRLSNKTCTDFDIKLKQIKD